MTKTLSYPGIAWHEICQARATHITLGLRPWVIWVALAWQIPCHASHHVTTNNVRYWRTIEKSHNHVTRLYMTLMRGIVQSTNSFNFSAYIPVQLLKAYIYQLSQLFRGDILKGSGSNKQLLPKIRTLKEEVIDFAKMVLYSLCHYRTFLILFLRIYLNGFRLYLAIGLTLKKIQFWHKPSLLLNPMH